MYELLAAVLVLFVLVLFWSAWSGARNAELVAVVQRKRCRFRQEVDEVNALIEACCPDNPRVRAEVDRAFECQFVAARSGRLRSFKEMSADLDEALGHLAAARRLAEAAGNS